MTPNFQRKLITSKMSDNTQKHTLIYATEACEKGSQESLNNQFGLLKFAAENTLMLDCGPLKFDTLKIFFDGTRWILQVEAIG